MTFQVVERDAIVVNNADPRGEGRVQVFIYGVHDISGIKTPFENLPWAFSTQSPNFVSIPKIWTPIKVKHRFSFGTAMRSFAAQDALEWHSPSPYLKLTENRDPRLYLKFDSEKQKFLNESPVDYTTIKNKITELEEQKKEKESIRDSLQQDLKNLENSSQNLTSTTSQYDEVRQQLNFAEIEYNNLLSNQKAELRSKAEEFSGSEWENYYESNIKQLPEVGGLTINELFDSNESLYYTYFDAYTKPKIQTFSQDQKIILNSSLEKVNTLNVELSKLSNKVTDENDLEKTLNENKISVQKEFDSINQEIQSIDKQIDELKSQAPNAPNSLASIEQSRNLDARIGRYDENSGKVYNTQEELIGNWTGYMFYLPGYALQPGPSIPERKKLIPIDSKGRITEESYLQGTNLNGSISGQLSTIVDSSDSKIIEKSNNNKTYSCDISNETRLKILTKRKEIATAVRWLRDQILALFPIDGNSATAQWVKQTAKHLTALLKSIQKFLKFINEVILETAKIIAKIRQLINWILSLPARLLALLQDCLTHFFNSISGAFSESISIGGLGGSDISFTEVTDLITQAQSTFNTATETVESTVIVYTEIKAIESTFEKV